MRGPRNSYGYEAMIVSMTEADDFIELAKEMRVELGDAPVRTYREVMARLAESARAAEPRRGQAR